MEDGESATVAALAKPRGKQGRKRMKTVVRVRGRKLFHRDVWRVRIDSKEWQYDKILIDGEHLSVVFRREETPCDR